MHIDVFNTTKEMIKTEVKLSFPNFTKSLHLYTNMSDL